METPRQRHLALESYFLIGAALRSNGWDIERAAASLHATPRLLSRQMIDLIRSEPLFSFPDLPADFKFHTSLLGVSRFEMRTRADQREKRRVKKLSMKIDKRPTEQPTDSVDAPVECFVDKS